MARTAGPVSVSEGLARVFALCRAMRLAASAAGAIDLAELATLHVPAVLDLAELADVERVLGVTLADDVLAVLAARIALLEAAAGLSLTKMLDVAREAADDVDPKWVAIAAIAENPLDPNADETPSYYVCVPRSEPSAEAPVMLWAIDEGTEGAGTPMPLAVLLEEQLDRAFGQWEIWPDVLARLADEPVDLFARPALAGEPTAWQPRRVRHKVFGAGTVVGVAGDGKLHVEFDAVGRKTVLESFVTDV